MLLVSTFIVLKLGAQKKVSIVNVFDNSVSLHSLNDQIFVLNENKTKIISLKTIEHLEFIVGWFDLGRQQFYSLSVG